jgi:hypothetical protein
MIDETRSFRVIEFKESDIEKKIVISEDDLKEAYDFAPEKKERTYKEMREELKTSLKQEKLQTEINNVTRQIEDALMAGETIEDIAKKFNLLATKVEDIDSHNKNAKSQEALKMNYKNDVISMAFSLDEGTDSSFSEVLDEKKNKVFWLVHLDSITPKHVAEFSSIPDKVRKEWTKNKQHEKVTKMANDFISNILNGADLAVLAAQNGRISNVTQPFDRYGTLQNAKSKKFSHIIAEVYDDVFLKKKKEASYKEINGIIVVYQIKDIILPEKIDSKDKLKYNAALSKEMTDDLYQQLVGHLSKKYKIIINYEMLRNINEDINSSTFDEIF